MEDAHKAILKSLPFPRRRSKLEPYAALIRALRARGRSYREIVTILRERCGLSVSVHAVHHFVQARARRTTAPRRVPRAAGPRVRPPQTIPPSAPVSAEPEGVWARIAAVKQRARVAARPQKAFAYHEDEPLQLVDDAKPRRT